MIIDSSKDWMRALLKHPWTNAQLLGDYNAKVFGESKFTHKLYGNVVSNAPNRLTVVYVHCISRQSINVSQRPPVRELRFCKDHLPYV